MKCKLNIKHKNSSINLEINCTRKELEDLNKSSIEVLKILANANEQDLITLINILGETHAK